MEEENDLLNGFDGDLLDGFGGSSDFDNDPVPGQSQGQQQLDHLAAVKVIQDKADQLYQSGKEDGLSAWFQRRKIGAGNAILAIGEDIAAVSELVATKLGFDEAAEQLSNDRQAIIRNKELNLAQVPTAFKGEAVSERVDAFLLDDGTISKNNTTGTGKAVSVEVDPEKGLLENVRDDQNLIIDVSPEAVKGFNDSGLVKDYKRSLSVSQALTNSEQSIYDIGSMILGAAPVKLAVKGGSKAAKRAVLTGYAGTAAGVQSFSDNYADALRKHGGDVDLAMNTATAKSAATGLLTVAIGKLDLDLIGGADLVSKKVTESAARFAAGEVTRKELVGGFLKEVTKGIAGETLEEIVDVVAGNMIERASGLDTDLLNNDQLLETVATSVFATAPFSAYNSTAKLSPTGILTQSAYSAAKDPIGFAELIDETIQEAGGVDAATLQEAEDKKAFIFELSNNLDLISDLGEDRQVELTSKLIQKRNLQKRLPTEDTATNLDPILIERTKIQLAEIDNDIIGIVEGRTAPIDPIVPVNQQGEAPQVRPGENTQTESVEKSQNEAITEGQSSEQTTKQQVQERPVIEAEVAPTPKIESTNTGKARQLSIESLEDDLAVRLTEGMKLNQSDFDQAFDPNIRKDRGVAINKMLDSNDNGVQLDVLAQELGDKWGVDEAEARESIVRFMAEQKLSDYYTERLQVQFGEDVRNSFSDEQIEALGGTANEAVTFSNDAIFDMDDPAVEEVADTIEEHYTNEDGSINYEQLNEDLAGVDNFEPEALNKLAHISGEGWAVINTIIQSQSFQTNQDGEATKDNTGEAETSEGDTSEPIRNTSNEGTESTTGGSPADRGNDPTGTTSEGGRTEPTATRAEPSTEGNTTDPEGGIKANNANFQAIRKELLGDDLPEAESKSFAESMAEAEQNHISSDLSKEIALSDQILQTDYIANDAEVLSLGAAVGRVKDSIKSKRSALSTAKKKRDKVAVNSLKTAIEQEQQQLDTLTRAGKKTGTQSARSLQIRSQVFDYDRYNRSAIEDAYRDASNDGAILHTDKRHANRLSEKIVSKQSEIDQLQEKIQEERLGDLRAKAARVMKNEVKADTTLNIEEAKAAIKGNKNRTTIKDAIVSIAKAKNFGAITDAIKALRNDTPVTDSEVVEAMLLPPTDSERSSTTSTKSAELAASAFPSEIRSELQKNESTLKLLQKHKTKFRQVEKILQAELEKDSYSVPNDKDIATIADAVDNLVQLATSGEVNLLASDKIDILDRLNNIPALVSAAFQTDILEAKKAHIQHALENLAQVQAALNLGQIDQKILQQKNTIANLQSKAPDLSFLDQDNKLFLTGTNKLLLQKQQELDELKREVEKRRADIARKNKAKEGFNLLGLNIKGDGVTQLKEALLIAKDKGLEVPRTLQFMFDASMFGVQLAPFVVPTVTGANIDFKALAKGELGKAFSNQQLLFTAFMDGFVKVVLNDLTGIKDGGRSTAGLFARKLYNQVANDPMFELATKAKLKLSKSRSLTDSEEFFTTELINRVPVMGAIKDISEDTMVSSLNIIRLGLFKQLVQNNPTADADTIKKFADSVNVLTGTVSDRKRKVSAFNWLMSAPRLAVSRLQLAASPITALNRRDTADKAFSNAVMQMMAGYSLAFFAAQLAGLKPCLDPKESCFLRLQGEEANFDITGGMGSIYRMAATVGYMTAGLPEDASNSAKRRFQQKEARKDTPLKEVLKTMVQYKIHPAFSAASGVLSGRSFFGGFFPADGLGVLDPADPVDSRVEAVTRSLVPISATSIYDNYFDKDMETETKMLLNFVQFFGVNSYKYFSPLDQPRTKEYFERVGYFPRVRYPEQLQQIEGKNKRAFIKSIYKSEWQKMIGIAIESSNYELDQENLKGMIKKGSDNIVGFDTAFLAKYELN